MLDSNTILGTGYYLGSEHYKHAIITQNLENWPCATPIVYSSDHDLNNIARNSSIRTALLFSTRQNHSWVYETTASIIQPIDLKPLADNHKVLTISEFDLGKWSRIREFVRDVGGISFIIENKASRSKAPKSVQAIERLFKYSTYLHYNTSTSRTLENEDDRLVCVMTLLDLPYCVPIFNTRKVDGIGLSFNVATVARSVRNKVLNKILRADFIFSNYEDNVFFVDGVTVNTHKPLNDSVLQDMRRFCSLELKIRKISKVDIGSKYGYTARPKDQDYRAGGLAGVKYRGEVKKKSKAVDDLPEIFTELDLPKAVEFDEEVVEKERVAEPITETKPADESTFGITGYTISNNVVWGDPVGASKYDDNEV